MKKIKRFCKYKAVPYIREYFKNFTQRKIIATFLGAGLGLLGVFKFGIIELLELLGYIQTPTLAEVVISKLMGCVMVAFSMIWAHRLMKRIEQSQIEKPKAILKQFSIDSSEKNDTSNNYKRVTYVLLDQRRKEAEHRMNWLQRSLHKQREIIGDFFYVVERWDQPVSHYEGLASIPFVFLLGYQISDKRDIVFHEWNENKKKWEQLPQQVAVYPRLQLHQIIRESDERSTKEIAICISLTTCIHEEQLIGSPGEGKNLFHLRLDECRRHAIVCVDQLNEYKEQFRALIDRMNNTYPNLEKVHVYVSAQTSLVFTLGSAITRNDKEVWAYNFETTENVKYPWGVKLHKHNVDIKKRFGELIYLTES